MRSSKAVGRMPSGNSATVFNLLRLRFYLLKRDRQQIYDVALIGIIIIVRSVGFVRSDGLISQDSSLLCQRKDSYSHIAVRTRTRIAVYKKHNMNSQLYQTNHLINQISSYTSRIDTYWTALSLSSFRGQAQKSHCPSSPQGASFD